MGYYTSCSHQQDVIIILSDSEIILFTALVINIHVDYTSLLTIVTVLLASVEAL